MEQEPINQAQFKQLMDELKKTREENQTLGSQINDDRKDINKLTIDSNNIITRLETMNNTLETLFDRLMEKMGDKIDEAIDRKLPSVVKREIRLLSVNNPRKKVAGKIGLLERFKLLFKFNK